MYEPIRTKSVHRMSGGRADHSHDEHGEHGDFPHSSRGESLDAQLAGHLAALLAVTDELCLDEAAERISGEIARLRGRLPVRITGRPITDAARGILHQRAHDLAARVLLVAASRADTAVAILAAERMDAHSAALSPAGAL
ncbi:hypothetical protein [Streptomyces sp. G-G2]|uniref:SCO4983 family protein n=1 Tax=Streptomyces sp. G-G2 TaxID=3046201 RepID=UPI0024B98A6B|nr:hypothetical protein [Streptomyces sp. G-G2]MDJ0385900.1 hypothetical protein [Streptomyces sp. G-G2]